MKQKEQHTKLSKGMDMLLPTRFEASVSECCACEEILRYSSEEWWALGPNTPKACVFFPGPRPLFPRCCDETGQSFETVTAGFWVAQ